MVLDQYYKIHGVSKVTNKRPQFRVDVQLYVRDIPVQMILANNSLTSSSSDHARVRVKRCRRISIKCAGNLGGPVGVRQGGRRVHCQLLANPGVLRPEKRVRRPAACTQVPVKHM